jgi:solute carrier family 24 (sodium/potassium/calcium exchanger), member 6
MASFSLVGALEFREFVTSMTPHAASSQLSMFDTTPSPFAGGYYSHRPVSWARTPTSRGASGEYDPWDSALGASLQLDNRAHSPVPVPDRMAQSLVLSPRHASAEPINDGSSEAETASSHSGDITITIPPLARTRRQKVFYALRRTWEILFPTLHDFRSKSAATKLASLFAAPAVLALTLTLPVVVTPYSEPSSSSVKVTRAPSPVLGPLVDIVEEGEGEIERAVMAEEEVVEQMHDHLRFHKWLMAAQCILGPLFVAKILFG